VALCLAGGNSLGQVIASQIVARQGYVWALRYAVIFMAAYVLSLFFFAPETTYVRAKKYDTDVLELLSDEVSGDAASASISNQNLPSAASVDEKTAAEDNTKTADLESAGASNETRTTYVQSLRVFNGRYSDENHFKALVAPFATYMLPGVV
jgi:hypothetical protein